MQQPKLSIYVLCLFFSCFFFSCENEGKIFVGEWQDSRAPENVWEIKKSGSVYMGKRISGDDLYEYETEEWKFEIGQAGMPSLVPTTEGGSTLQYQAAQKRFLRNPPGRAYVKVIKEK